MPAQRRHRDAAVDDSTLRRAEEGNSALPVHTPPKWRLADGHRRFWTTGTQSAKPSPRASRERDGRTCSTSSWK